MIKKLKCRCFAQAVGEPVKSRIKTTRDDKAKLLPAFAVLKLNFAEGLQEVAKTAKSN